VIQGLRTGIRPKAGFDRKRAGVMALKREKIAVTNVALPVEPADRWFTSKRFMTACLFESQ
jgi:hypothetical protein